jgi:hypothetical protein
MSSTPMCIFLRDQESDLRYEHRCIRDGVERASVLDTLLIKESLGDVLLSLPDVREWLRASIAQGEQQLEENSDARTEIH